MDFSEYGGKSEEWLALEATLPPPVDLSPVELKRTTNETRSNAARDQMKVLSSQVTINDHSIPTRDGYPLEARIYRSSSIDSSEKLPIYIHFHGGGFFFGTIDSEDATCSRIAIAANVLVVNVNYRHTPEYVYPTAWHDSEDSFAWLYDHASDLGADQSQIVIGGVSAGAYLTASLTQLLEREQDPKRHSVVGQVLMIPPLIHMDQYPGPLVQLKDPDNSSLKENEFAPILPIKRIELYIRMLHPEPPNRDDRRANPGLATPAEVAKLPPATFGCCGLDPVRDEGLLYAKLLQDNGVPVNVNVFKGLPHAYRTFGDKLPQSSAAWDKVMNEGIQWALNKPTHSPTWDVHVY